MVGCSVVNSSAVGLFSSVIFTFLNLLNGRNPRINAGFEKALLGVL
jgi:hypothetical protein